MADYVLGHFSKDERELMADAYAQAASAAVLLAEGEVTQAMNTYNKKPKKEQKKEKEKEKEKTKGGEANESTDRAANRPGGI